MDRLISCKFNMDTACVELDYLIYNDPIGYADLILNGDSKTYLKNCYRV